jgi:hypothetical protein
MSNNTKQTIEEWLKKNTPSNIPESKTVTADKLASPTSKPVKYNKGGMVKKYKKGGAVAFKPCKGCPTPAKCKKAGKCLAKASKKK